jgi:hypothetical protein
MHSTTGPSVNCRIHQVPKDKFNIIANIFHYHKEKIAGVKPDLQQWESISNTFGTYHNQDFVTEEDNLSLMSVT